MENLIFNGISTIDMGVRIQSPPVYEFSSKEYELLRIEGTSGNLVINKNTFRNVKRKYVLILGFGPDSPFVSNANMIVDWLMSANGYARLEDSYEPDYYRMALFEDSGEMPNIYDRATVLEVSFACKPQRYLKSGEVKKTIEQLDTFVKIINPTKYISLPEIVLDGDDIEIEFFSRNDLGNPKNTSSINSSYDSEFIIDSELQDCYVEDKYVNNHVVLDNEFPKLYPGINWIKISGSILRKFEIKPRWWTL